MLEGDCEHEIDGGRLPRGVADVLDNLGEPEEGHEETEEQRDEDDLEDQDDPRGDGQVYSGI